jgi:hypothetical protein
MKKKEKANEYHGMCKGCRNSLKYVILKATEESTCRTAPRDIWYE